MRVAAIQYEVGRAADLPGFLERIDHLVAGAVAREAELVVFPEYICVDLLRSQLPKQHAADALALRNAHLGVADSYATFVEGVSSISQVHDVWIMAGTFVHRSEMNDEVLTNAAQLFGPNGRHWEQAKLHVAYEMIHNRDLVTPGDKLRVFDLDGVRLGIAVCYDAQFPETARSLLQAGTIDVLLIPGATLEPWGVWRLRTATQARAMETLCFGVNVQLAGAVFHQRPIYQFHARSSIVTPLSKPFPHNGILVDSEKDRGDQVLIADLDIAGLRSRRSEFFPSLDDRRDLPEPTEIMLQQI